MRISKKRVQQLSTILAGLLLFLSAFSRYDSQWLETPINYPSMISTIIDLNRPLIGIIIATSLLALTIIRKKIIIPSAYMLICAFHLYLSFKSINHGSQAWIFGATGSLIILFACTIFFHSISNTNKDVFFLFYICTAWVVAGLVLIATQGFNYYSTNERLYLFSAHPNHAASIWAVATFIMLYVACNNIGRIRPIATILGLICVYFLISTGSRGAMLSLLAGTTVFFWFNIKKYRWAIYLIPAGALLLISYTFIAGETIANFLSYQIDRGNTRAGTYGAALNSFIENPFFGLPINTTRYLYVENTILASMQLGGIIGLIMILFFYINSVQKFIKICTWRTIQRNETAFFYAALFSIALTQSMFEAFPLNFITTGAFLMIYSIMGMKKLIKNNKTLRQPPLQTTIKREYN